MAKIDFCVSVHDATRKAEHDPQGAADLLLLAAEYIRSGEPLPSQLADYLAGAIEASMGKPPEHRNAAFLAELRLTNGNRRAAADWFEVGMAFDALIDSGLSQNQAKAQIAAEMDVSESTAVRMYKQWINANEEASQIDRDERE